MHDFDCFFFVGVVRKMSVSGHSGKAFLQRNVFWLISGKPPRNASIFDLPRELSDCMVSYLPVPSKVCGALFSSVSDLQHRAAR